MRVGGIRIYIGDKVPGYWGLHVIQIFPSRILYNSRYSRDLDHLLVKSRILKEVRV